jgi:hypothetical protein
MNFPIRFQSDTDVILEEVARFRALTTRERMQSIRSILSGRSDSPEVSEGGLAEAVFRRAGAPRPPVDS